MSSAILSQTPALWRQTIDYLQKACRVEWKALLVYVAILFVLNLVSASLIDLDALRQEGTAFLRNPQIMAELGIFGLLHGIVFVGTLYVLLARSLNLIEPGAHVRPTVQNFFYWVKVGILKYCMLLVPLFGVIFVFASTIFLKPLVAVKILGSVAILAILCSQYYGLLRLMLVSPLAILGKPEVIKQSWHITRGKCWRIFGNACVVLLILLLLFLIPFIGVLIVQSVAGHTSLVSRIFSFIVDGVWQAIILLATAIYYCVVYHVLSREYAIHSSPSASLN